MKYESSLAEVWEFAAFFIIMLFLFVVVPAVIR